MKRTKPDETRQLTLVQERAADLLVAGQRDQDVAEAVGVTRQTVNGWRHHDPAFIAALNVRRRRLWETAVAQLRALVPRALDVLAAELDHGDDRLKAALAVIKLAGLERFFTAPPADGDFGIGPTTPAGVRAAAAADEVDALLAAMLGRPAAVAGATVDDAEA